VIRPALYPNLREKAVKSKVLKALLLRLFKASSNCWTATLLLALRRPWLVAVHDHLPKVQEMIEEGGLTVLEGQQQVAPATALGHFANAEIAS
jgi:hypothetical protein